MTIPTTLRSAVFLAVVLAITSAVLALSGLSTGTADASTAKASASSQDLGPCKTVMRHSDDLQRSGSVRVGVISKRLKRKGSFGSTRGSLYVCRSSHAHARAIYSWNGADEDGYVYRPRTIQVSKTGKFVAYTWVSVAPAATDPESVAVVSTKSLRIVSSSWTVSGSDKLDDKTVGKRTLVISDTGACAWITNASDGHSYLYGLTPTSDRSQLVSGDLGATPTIGLAGQANVTWTKRDGSVGSQLLKVVRSSPRPPWFAQ